MGKVIVPRLNRWKIWINTIYKVRPYPPEYENIDIAICKNCKAISLCVKDGKRVCILCRFQSLVTFEELIRYY